MTKLDLKNLSPAQATQMLGIIKKEIQSLDGDKSRLIKDCNDANEKLNKANEKLKKIDDIFAEREAELVKKYEEKEKKLDRKLENASGRETSASAKEGELNKAIKDNKDAEKKHNAEADTARSNNNKALKLLGGFKEIKAYLDDKLKNL